MGSPKPGRCGDLQSGSRQSHDLPFPRGNDNCASGGLRAGSRDQDLDICPTNISDWRTAHPGARRRRCVHLAHPLGGKGFNSRGVENDERAGADLADL